MFNFLKNIFSKKKKVDEKPVSEAANPQEESTQQELSKIEAKPDAQKEG